MKDKLVFPDGLTCSYIEEGSGDPLVLIHGFGGSKEIWQDNIDILSKKYRVIAYDLLGHGEGTIPEDTELSDTALADQLHGLLVSLGIKSCHLVAHSLGACVVFQYVMKYGNEMLNKVIIADMTPSMNAYDDWDLISVGGFGSRSALEWMQRDYEGYMRAIVSAAGTQDLSEEEFEKELADFLGRLQQGPATKVLECCQADFRPALGLFEVPFAYFYADPGMMLVRPAELAEYYRTHVKSPVKIVPFHVSTHSFPQEMPDVFAEEVEKFLG